VAERRALIGQSSAGERLKGVALVSHVRQPDDSVLTGLLDLVDNDPNVNVRLSAVDALYLFSAHPQIREGLTRSLGRQTAPVVQIAIIDLVVAIREKQAAEALKKLVDDQGVRPEVRQRARSGIEKLL
jgi:HEAT repeats